MTDGHAASADGAIRQGVSVHLEWIEGVDDARTRAYRSLLAPSETERHDRFKVEGARTEFLVGRGLLRTVLSRCRPDVLPSQWRFALNPYGRPAIDWFATDAEAADLFFNLSHTRGLVALIVGPTEDIGVDVEAIARGAPDQDVARRFFTSSEADWIDSGEQEAERTERFFALWTLKEAYIKARGMGLSLPLDGFFFDCMTSEDPTITFNDKLDDRPQRWRFERRLVGNQHRLALACPASVGSISFFATDAAHAAPRAIAPAKPAAFS